MYQNFKLYSSTFHLNNEKIYIYQTRINLQHKWNSSKKLILCLLVNNCTTVLLLLRLLCDRVCNNYQFSSPSSRYKRQQTLDTPDISGDSMFKGPELNTEDTSSAHDKFIDRTPT